MNASPPSQLIVWPVMNPASSEARNAATPTRSCGASWRLRHCILSIASFCSGVTVARALEAATAAGKRTAAPLLFMTYLNPILAFGLERFCRAAAAAGVDGLIVPDLPPTESVDLRRAADAFHIDVVFFVAPTSSEAGIAAACRAATGFIYCIAVTGVTGARAELDPSLLPLIDTVRKQTKLPIVVGFGISRVEHLKALEGKADGVIVASALLDAIARAPEDPATQVRQFLGGLRRQPTG